MAGRGPGRRSRCCNLQHGAQFDRCRVHWLCRRCVCGSVVMHSAAVGALWPAEFKSPVHSRWPERMCRLVTRPLVLCCPCVIRACHALSERPRSVQQLSQHRLHLAADNALDSAHSNTGAVDEHSRTAIVRRWSRSHSQAQLDSIGSRVESR